MNFFAEFIRDPKTVGGILPSGPALAEFATGVVPSAGEPVVVELGPGTGAFTGAIQRRLAGRGRHLAFEINPRFVAYLAAMYPGVDIVHADAGELRTVLARRDIRRADVVVSGLPWASFSDTRQRLLLGEVIAALPPDGAFTAFTYVHARWLPSAHRLLRTLREHFADVVVGRIVWSNPPPALVYECRGPVPVVAMPARNVPDGHQDGTFRSAPRS